MGLSPAQISILRFAEAHSDGVYYGSAAFISFHPKLPLKGAVAHTVVNSLRRRGLLDAKGRITVGGRGALMRDPQAASAETDANAL